MAMAMSIYRTLCVLVFLAEIPFFQFQSSTHIFFLQNDKLTDLTFPILFVSADAMLKISADHRFSLAITAMRGNGNGGEAFEMILLFQPLIIITVTVNGDARTLTSCSLTWPT